MTIFNRYSDSIADILQDHNVLYSKQLHEALTDGLWSMVNEEFQLHYDVWGKLQADRSEAWSARNTADKKLREVTAQRDRLKKLVEDIITALDIDGFGYIYDASMGDLTAIVSSYRDEITAAFKEATR